MILYHQQSIELKLTLAYTDLYFNLVIWLQLEAGHTVTAIWPALSLSVMGPHYLGLPSVSWLPQVKLPPWVKAQQGLSCDTDQSGLSCPAAATHLCQLLCHSWCLIRPSSLWQFCCLLRNPCLNNSCSILFCHHISLTPLIFGSAVGTCMHPHTDKANHKVNPWLYHTDSGPSSVPLDMALALGLPGIPVLAFYFFFENSFPLPPWGAHLLHLLSEFTLMMMSSALCCLLVTASELGQLSRSTGLAQIHLTALVTTCLSTLLYCRTFCTGW